jgi:hypothetical protein
MASEPVPRIDEDSLCRFDAVHGSCRFDVGYASAHLKRDLCKFYADLCGFYAEFICICCVYAAFMQIYELFM